MKVYFKALSNEVINIDGQDTDVTMLKYLGSSNISLSDIVYDDKDLDIDKCMSGQKIYRLSNGDLHYIETDESIRNIKKIENQRKFGRLLEKEGLENIILTLSTGTSTDISNLRSKGREAIG